MSQAPARHRVGRHRAKDYWKVAVHLMESARALIALGDEEYGNAIGICLIHAVICANDAVTIDAAEVRSSSEHHADAQKLLLEVVRDVPVPVVRAFSSVVQAKFEVEYELTFSYQDDARLDKQIYDLLRDLDEEADMRHCFIQKPIAI